MTRPKEFVSPDQLLQDSFALGRVVYESGYRPEVLLAVWRGGTPVGIVVHEFLLYMGIVTSHAAIKVESYADIGRSKAPRVKYIEPVLDAIRSDAAVLVIDDIFDTGQTLATVCARLRTKTSSVKTATLYLRQRRRARTAGPDFFVRVTDRWVVFPHEIVGLTAEEIRHKGHGLCTLIASTQHTRALTKRAHKQTFQTGSVPQRQGKE
ncbi:MAG: phosphoribosyltransferase [Kiritimatiellia bacterium]